MGVSPPLANIIYVGQEKIEGTFTVNTYGEKNLKTYASGGLKEYVFLDGDETELKRRVEGSTTVKYSLRLPKDLKPGNYRIVIVSEQYFTMEEEIESGGTARAFAAIGFVIKLRVPNDGKFLEASMTIEPAKINIGDDVYFIIDMLNFGTEDLTDLYADVTVNDPKGETLSEKQTKSIDILKPGQSRKVVSSWQTGGYSSGEYSIEARIDYGGDYLAEPKSRLRIGDIFIEILDVTTELNGTVGKFIIDIQSNWNDVIKNVYAEIIIKKDDETIDRIRTSSIDISPWGKDKLVAFWERNSLLPGDYDVEIYVYYYDKQARSQLKVNLPELEKEAPSPEMSPLLIIAVGLLVIILLINLIWMMHRLRNNKTEKKRRK